MSTVIILATNDLSAPVEILQGIFFISISVARDRLVAQITLTQSLHQKVVVLMIIRSDISTSTEVEIDFFFFRSVSDFICDALGVFSF